MTSLGAFRLCGSQKSGCGYPPSLARSQRDRPVILGMRITRDRYRRSLFCEFSDILAFIDIVAFSDIFVFSDIFAFSNIFAIGGYKFFLSQLNIKTY